MAYPRRSITAKAACDGAGASRRPLLHLGVLGLLCGALAAVTARSLAFVHSPRSSGRPARTARGAVESVIYTGYSWDSKVAKNIEKQGIANYNGLTSYSRTETTRGVSTLRDSVFVELVLDEDKEPEEFARELADFFADEPAGAVDVVMYSDLAQGNFLLALAQLAERFTFVANMVARPTFQEEMRVRVIGSWSLIEDGATAQFRTSRAQDAKLSALTKKVQVCLFGEKCGWKKAKLRKFNEPCQLIAPVKKTEESAPVDAMHVIRRAYEFSKADLMFVPRLQGDDLVVSVGMHTVVSRRRASLDAEGPPEVPFLFPSVTMNSASDPMELARTITRQLAAPTVPLVDVTLRRLSKEHPHSILDVLATLPSWLNAAAQPANSNMKRRINIVKDVRFGNPKLGMGNFYVAGPNWSLDPLSSEIAEKLMERRHVQVKVRGDVPGASKRVLELLDRVQFHRLKRRISFKASYVFKMSREGYERKFIDVLVAA